MSQVKEQTADYQLADLSPALKTAEAGNVLLESLPVWLSAQTRKSAGRGRSAGNTLQYGVQKLRELILELAVRGKLVPQDLNDEPASILLEKIAEEKARLVKECKIKKPKVFNHVEPEEQPYHLPTGWQWVRLGLITEANTGFAFKSSEYREHGMLVLRVTNINSDGTINTQDAKFIDPLDAQEKYENFALNEDDVLLVMVGGSLGKIGIIPNNVLPAVLNQNMWKLTRFGSILRDYFVYGLKYINNNLLEITSSTHGHLAQGEYLSKPFPLPPLTEQHRIVKKVDELIALCDQLEQQQADAVQAHDTLVKVLLDTLTQSENANEFQQNWRRIAEHFDTLFTTESSIDQIKQTLLQLAVMGKLVSQDPNDQPASILLEKIASEKAVQAQNGKVKKTKPRPRVSQEEEHFNLPLGWQWVRLGDVSYVFSGNSFSSSDFSNKGGVKVIKITNAGVGELVETNDFLPRDFLEKYEAYRVIEGDLILALTRPYISSGLKVSFCPPSYDNSLLNQRVAAIRPFINTQFIYKYMQSVYVLGLYQRRFGNSGLQPNLKMSDVTDLVIPIPPIAEQHRIVKKVDELMALCDQLKDRLNHTQTLQQQLADAVAENTINSK